MDINERATMIAVKAKFDGKHVVLPEGMEPLPAGEVFVLFELDDWQSEDPGYLASLEQTLAKAWDNPDDDVFNDM